MGNKKSINVIFLIIAIILGTTLFKHFNFKTFSFKKPALDVVFLITFIVSIYLLMKDYNKQPEK